MRFPSYEISRDDVKPGDHIYSWRKPIAYAHHGIYVGDGMVIHFSCSSKKQGDICPTCGNQSQLDGPRSSCLDCFLAGGKLCRFNYSSSIFAHIFKSRGECTEVPSDPPEEVFRRANYLLHNGFGGYNIVTNNCEHFAFYCKTGLVWGGFKGMSNQVKEVIIAGIYVSIVVAGTVMLHSLVTMPFYAVMVPLYLPLLIVVTLYLIWNRINRFYHKVSLEELVSQINAGMAGTEG